MSSIRLLFFYPMNPFISILLPRCTTQYLWPPSVCENVNNPFCVSETSIFCDMDPSSPGTSLNLPLTVLNASAGSNAAVLYAIIDTSPKSLRNIRNTALPHLPISGQGVSSPAKPAERDRALLKLIRARGPSQEQKGVLFWTLKDWGSRYGRNALAVSLTPRIIIIGVSRDLNRFQTRFFA